MDPRTPDELLAGILDARRHSLRQVEDFAEAQWRGPYLQIVNPAIWELAHMAFFYEVFVVRPLARTPPLIERGDELFDSFVAEHTERWKVPYTPQQVLDYLQRVEEHVVALVRQGPSDAAARYLYELGNQHEDMHGEALAYTRQTYGYAPPPKDTPPPPVEGGGPHPGDVEVPGGTYQLGATSDLPFVFDNEKWAHEVRVEPFAMARAPVTQAEFLAFVEDGGYGRRELWSYTGWRWRTRAEASAPLYWRQQDGRWLRRHFDAELELEPHLPVIHVSYFEAEAYCAWAKRRLPSEAEWELCASAGNEKRRYPWGQSAPTPAQANLDTRRGGCIEVGALPASDSFFGCRQMIGNVWQWTSSDFYPFPGYVVDRPYREYSAPWFGTRKVLRGGCWATRSRVVRNTYRNFFEPWRRDVLAGFRTCRA